MFLLYVHSAGCALPSTHPSRENRFRCGLGSNVEFYRYIAASIDDGALSHIARGLST